MGLVSTAHLDQAVPDAVCVLLVLAAHAVFEQLLAPCINVAFADDGLVDAVVGPGTLQAKRVQNVVEGHTWHCNRQRLHGQRC